MNAMKAECLQKFAEEAEFKLIELKGQSMR